MIDRTGRAAFRTRVRQALDTISTEEKGERERAFWRPFRVQLEALLAWTKDDNDPPIEHLEKITLGHLALRELGEELRDVPPHLVPLYEQLKEIQTNVMDWYVPFT